MPPPASEPSPAEFPSVLLPRSSGVLLHPSSLPGRYGIGDLGPEAFRWVETLAAAKQSWWQVLPLGPTGFGNSPYQSFSSMAGNVNLLSPDLLVRDGLLPDDFHRHDRYPDDRVDFDRVAADKGAMVREAWDRFSVKPVKNREAFQAYCNSERAWLDDYALFMAARDALGQAPLHDWPADVRTRKPVALAELGKSLKKEVLIYQFGQYLFDAQWRALRAFARSKGVRFIGDAPIFVAGDSADVWANAGEFLLDAHGSPKAVAGVPPDYFSADGQLWGNPLYDWAAMAETGYRWWLARLTRQLAQVDLIRLDHFRGFAAAWHVPTGETTAKNGHWVEGPGAALFTVLRDKLGVLPFIAEDLGLITPDVDALRTAFGMPGMRVLQFMIDKPANPYWPHNYEPNTVAYTGTHDNDTVRGWYATLADRDRRTLDRYAGFHQADPPWDLIRLAWASVAVLAVAPLQDLLGVGTEGRMNVPGVAAGNWGWRFRPEQFGGGVIEKLAELTELYSRVPRPADPPASYRR